MHSRLFDVEVVLVEIVADVRWVGLHEEEYKVFVFKSIKLHCLQILLNHACNGLRNSPVLRDSYDVKAIGNVGIVVPEKRKVRDGLCVEEHEACPFYTLVDCCDDEFGYP